MASSLAADQERIRQLTAHGVAVAEGRGSAGERAITWFAVALALAAGVWLGMHNATIWWLLPLMLVTLDFLSGVVHWLFDTRVAPGERLLGRIAINFLDHHVHPTRTCEVGFAATGWRVAGYVSLPLVALAVWLPAGIAQAMVYWLGALSLVVAETHKAAHRRCVGAPTRLLQRLHLALPPRAHRQHHRDHTRAFCVFTGWCNPLLDRLGFWGRLDRAMTCAWPGRRRASGRRPGASGQSRPSERG